MDIKRVIASSDPDGGCSHFARMILFMKMLSLVSFVLFVSILTPVL